MSVPVALEQLREEVGRYGAEAYFLTVSDEGRPHTVHLPVAWVDPGRLVVRPGRGTLANARARPLVSLLWPPLEPGGYSLIVDASVDSTVEPAGGGAGAGSGGGGAMPAVTLRPTRAVLHRSAAAADGALTPGSDCVRVFSEPK